jgi:hypothetical protein
VRIGDTILNESDRHVTVTEVSVHHIGTGSVVFAFTIDDNAQQLTATLVLVAT